MTTLRLVLGDQLDRNLSSLKGLNKETDVVLMAEVVSEATYVKHHKQKIALIFSAMRHFAEEMENEGVEVRYIQLNAADNSGSIVGELDRAIIATNLTTVCITEPAEYRLLRDLKEWSDQKAFDVEIKPDDRFFSDRGYFKNWSHGRKSLRME